MRLLFQYIGLAMLLLALGACSKAAPRLPSPVAVAASKTPAEKVDWAAMQAFWNRAMALPGIDTGPVDASKRMVVYFDPHCPVCAKQWQVLRPYLQQVRIHWVPVAYMDASSARVAAAMLDATDPVAALTTNEQNFDSKANKGGYQPSAAPSAARVAQVERNTRLARQAGDLMGTPTLGFELLRGQRYYRMTGLLESDAARIAVADLGTTADPWVKRRSGVAPVPAPAA